MSQLSLKSKALGGAAAVLFAAAFTFPVQAQTVPLYSAGSTLAEKIYRDTMNCYGNHSGSDTTAGLTNPPAICNTATPYNAGVELLYLGVGSGNGLLGFDNNDASHFTDGPKAADNPPVASTSDFGPFYGTGTGSSWIPNATDTGPFYPKVSFVGSDNPLGSADLTAYNAASNGWGAPVQFPGLVVGVAIPFSPTAGGFNQHGKLPAGGGGSSKVDLSTSTLCGIFNGDITDWSNSEIKADNGNVTLGTGAITVTYRSDSSGTTFLQSNALINQCAGTAHPIPSAWQTVAGNASGVGNTKFFLNVHTAGLLPANFVGANGSAGVKAAVLGTAGSIGYVSPDFVLPVDPAGPEAANLQTWASQVGTKVFKAPTAKNATAIVGATKAPLFTAASCPVGNAAGQSPDGICADNALNWGITFAKPVSTAAYPVGGFTFIDMYSCYHSAADVTALVGTTAGSLGYFRWYYGSATENASLVKTSLASNGFAEVPGAWISAIKKLLTSNKPSKIGIPGRANTACAHVTGNGA